MQGEGLVALAPRVTRPLVPLDDDRRDSELAQPGTERDAALAAADDQHLGLHGVAELGGLTGSALGPRDPVTEGAVAYPLGPPVVDRLLVALELVEGGEQRERLAADEPQQPAAPPGRGLERDPGGDDAVRLGRLLCDTETNGIDLVERGPQQVRDARASLGGGDVPGERDDVAPVALVGEQRRRRVGVAGGEGLLERGKPLIGGGRGRARLLVDGLGHWWPPRHKTTVLPA